jgi:AGZA family xanthine/uracil permease-like MFS transporter
MQAAEAGSGGALERIFKFKQWDTSVKRDTLAGLATFMVMAYIIFVNPNILGLGGAPEGLPFAAALTSTCLVAGVMTILMGLVTNRAYAIAPGMGLNAVVAFSLVAGQGLTMANAMGLVVLEGIAILILVLTGFREAIFKAIPLELKKAIVIGIGFFILFIGLVDGGLINVNGGTPVGLVDLSATAMVPLAVSVVGLVATIIMLALRWRAAILLGIIFATVFAIIMNYAWGQDAGFLPGQAVIPSDILAMPDFSLVGAFDFGAFGKLGVTAAVLWIFSLMLSDFFDTMGTLVGVGGQAGYLDKKGDLPQVNRALLVDSVAAAAGGAVSASSATTYIESGAGVAQGGRTGWVALVVGVLFLAAMFFSPLFGVVPGQATAAALIVVGYLMMATLTKAESEAEHDTREPKAGINFGNLAFGLPAVLIITIMPLTYSITNGIGAGFIAYTIIRVVQGKAREVSWMLWIASIAFILYFIFPWFQAQGWV